MNHYSAGLVANGATFCFLERGGVLDAPRSLCLVMHRQFLVRLFYMHPYSVCETLYIHVMHANSNLDISCSLTTSYEDLLLSTEPFQQPISLAVSSLRYTGFGIKF